MKKFLFLILLLCLAISCDPGEFLIRHSSRWFIKNISEQPIVIGFPKYEGYYRVQPNDSFRIGWFEPFRKDGEPQFEKFYEISIHNSVVTITDTNGTLLEKWDPEDIAEKQSIYNESNWVEYKRTVCHDPIILKYDWVYEFK